LKIIKKLREEEVLFFRKKSRKEHKATSMPLYCYCTAFHVSQPSIVDEED
jgi:hypothetical protein